MAHRNVIRECNISEYSGGRHNFESYARIEEDTDTNHILTVCYAGKVTVHCAIRWLEKDQKQVDWLAWVMLTDLRKAYEQGKRDAELKVRKQLEGLKELLNV